MAPAAAWSALDVLAGRTILLAGSTGFIGKVLLSMFLDRQPAVGKVTLLVRPKPGREIGEGLLEALAACPPFEPLRRVHGRRAAQFLRERLECVRGDMTRPDLGLSPEALGALRGRVDVVINNAGLVALNPPLDESLAINATGALHGAQVAARLGAALVHVSTCYVAGLRSGEVPETPPEPGWFPWRDGGGGGAKSRRDCAPRDPETPETFDPRAELLWCERRIAGIRAEAAGPMRPLFLEKARERLRDRGRPADGALDAAVSRLARRWVEERLVEEGRRRARRWGWANTYCYAKALGEALVAATPGARWAIVRPSIVESAARYPFPGWNEGLNTSAPVILAMCRGHALWPAHRKAALDLIPVDMVAAGILAAAAAAVSGRHRPVYHLASSDTNPLSVRRCMRFVGEYRRRHWRDHFPEGPLWQHWLWTRLGVVPVPEGVYRRLGVPAFRRAVASLARALDRARPRAPGPKGTLRGSLAALERELGQVEHVVETFLPFIHDTDCVFRTDSMRELHAGLAPADREALPWGPERLDWRDYWFNVHLPGLRRWVFPGFEGRGVPGRAPGHWPAVGLIRYGLGLAQKAAYSGLFRTRVEGARHIPRAEPFLVASNHASHLDMGLIKHSLGPAGRDLVALAAKDYFFRSPALAFFFRHFTNLLPIGRRTAIKDSLKAASQALRRGRRVLIFPEATRSVTGEMAPFKPAVGYLALHNKVGVLPVYLSGTYRAMPKGSVVPKSFRLGAHIGPFLSYDELARRTSHLPPREAYRAAAAVIEEAVRRLERDHSDGAGVR